MNSKKHFLESQDFQAAVTEAREQVAELVGADSREIVWTSGATESNNLALKGAAEFYEGKGKHLVTMTTEHKAVLDPLQELERKGFAVTRLDPQPDELVLVSDADSMIVPAFLGAAVDHQLLHDDHEEDAGDASAPTAGEDAGHVVQHADLHHAVGNRALRRRGSAAPDGGGGQRRCARQESPALHPDSSLLDPGAYLPVGPSMARPSDSPDTPDTPVSPDTPDSPESADSPD